MNPVLLTCYNNVELTRRAVDSLRQQDIPIDLYIINNGSTDGTREYLDSLTDDRLSVTHYPENLSPIMLANWMLAILFERCSYVLAVPNDAIFPPNLYSQLLKFPEGIVGARMDCMDEDPPVQVAEVEHSDPHLAVCLIRRSAHFAIVAEYGNFLDTDYFMYASDCDLKRRMKQTGVVGVQTSIRCFHYGSASWRLAPEAQQKAMLTQADKDRETYFRKWGEKL